MQAILFVLLTFTVVLCEDFISHNPTTGVKVRQKRSFICKFRLTGVLRTAVLSSLKDIREYDPLEIGNYGDGSLQDGILRGLSTLTNITDLEVYCETNNLLILTSEVGFRNLEIRYKWSYKFIFTISGNVWVKIREINVEYAVHLNSTNRYNFEVAKLSITKLEGVDVGFSGLGLLNPLVKGTLRLFYRFQEGRATEAIESRMKEALEKKLNEFPVDFNWFSFVSVFM